MDPAPRKRGIEFAKGALVPPIVFVLAGGIGWELLKDGSAGGRVAVFVMCLAVVGLLSGLGVLAWPRRRWIAYGLFGAFALCLAAVGGLMALLASAMGDVIGG